MTRHNVSPPPWSPESTAAGIRHIGRQLARLASQLEAMANTNTAWELHKHAKQLVRLGCVLAELAKEIETEKGA